MAITVKSTGYFANVGGTATCSLTGVSVGDWIVLLIGTDNSTAVTVTTTVGTTSAWTKITKTIGSGNPSSVVAYATVLTTSGGTLTATATAASSNVDASMIDASGISAFDSTAGSITASGTGTSQATGSLTPTGAGELFVASAAEAGQYASGTGSAPGGVWTGISVSGSTRRASGAYVVNAGSGAESAIFTGGGAFAWATVLAAFVPSAAAVNANMLAVMGP